jgi:hypothetical protein
MHLLQANVPLVTIKDVLGHADVKSTEVYVQIDLAMKREALHPGRIPGHADAEGGPPSRRPPQLAGGLVGATGKLCTTEDTRTQARRPLHDALNITGDSP